jgi:membrane protease YdiL (CAAX protease family)
MDVRLALPSVDSQSDRSDAPRVDIPQYNRNAILAIWAAAALPMASLAWIVAPRVASGLSGPVPLSRALLICLTGGLIWQFVLVLALVWREQRNLRWTTLCQALWLRTPRSPRTGRTGGRVWLILLPLIAGFAAEETVPGLPHAASRDFGEFLQSDAGHTLLHGAWGWFALLLVMFTFNTALGEELLFRGFLLPRMNGAFGRRDWLANGLLFAAYHLHVPWMIPATLIDTLVLAYPSKRYRSAWIGIAVHSTQTVALAVLVLNLVV